MRIVRCKPLAQVNIINVLKIWVSSNRSPARVTCEHIRCGPQATDRIPTKANKEHLVEDPTFGSAAQI